MDYNNRFSNGSIFYILWKDDTFDFVEVVDSDDKTVQVRILKVEEAETKIVKLWGKRGRYVKYNIFPGEYISDEITLEKTPYTNSPLKGKDVFDSSPVDKDYAWINIDSPTREYYSVIDQDRVEDAEGLTSGYSISYMDIVKNLLAVNLNVDFDSCPWVFLKFKSKDNDDVCTFDVIESNISPANGNNPRRGYHAYQALPGDKIIGEEVIPYKNGLLQTEVINGEYVNDIKVWDGLPLNFSWDSSD